MQTGRKRRQVRRLRNQRGRRGPAAKRIEASRGTVRRQSRPRHADTTVACQTIITRRRLLRRRYAAKLRCDSRSLHVRQEAFGGCRKIVLAPAKVVEDSNVPWAKLLGFAPDQVLQSPYDCNTLFEAMRSFGADASTPDAPSSSECEAEFAAVATESLS